MPASWCRNLRKAPSSAFVGAERFEAVDHHQPGTPLLHEFADPSEHAGQAVLVEDVTEILVEHPVAQCRVVEVVQGLAEAQQLVQWLGNGGQVQRGLCGGGVVEHVLLGQHRLPRSGAPADQGDDVERQAATENGIQRG